MLASYLPILVLLALGLGLGTALILVARLLGPKVESAEKDIPYESGLDPAGAPRIRFSVEFYRVALLFLVFDIEAAFFFPWAVLFRDLSCRGTMVGGVCHGQPSAFGLLVMVAFLAVLVLALLYVWRRKALEWR